MIKFEVTILCGRFARFSPAHIFRMLFQLDEFLELAPQYNIAPGYEVYAIRGIPIHNEQQQTRPPLNFQKEVTTLQWGLIPFWSKDPSIGNKMINARAETVAEKPAFKEAFKKQRCLIPANGFYEWQKLKDGSKQPYFIRFEDKHPMAFGGIWDRWKSLEGKVIQSFSILTTQPNEVMKPIHNRMPVIIDPEKFDVWLNPIINNGEDLQMLLQPYKSSNLIAYKISSYINSPKNQGEQCIAPLEYQTKQQKLF